MMTNKEDIEIYVEVKYETEKALFVSDGICEIWIPKSQIKEKYKVKCKNYNIIIPEWLAIEKGLI